MANGRQAGQAQGHNAVQRQQQRVGANRQSAAGAKGQPANKQHAAKGAAAAAAAGAADVDDASQAADDNDGQFSPFADADWRFDWGGPSSPNAAYAAAQQQSLMNQTFPDSPQFRTGRVFEIPADAGMGLPAAATAAMHGAGAMVGQQQPVQHGSPTQLAAAAVQGNCYGNAGAVVGGLAGGPLPLAQLQLLQQQPQPAQGVGWLGMHNEAEVRPISMALHCNLLLVDLFCHIFMRNAAERTASTLQVLLDGYVQAH
jgi:hypothetical protein